MRGIGGLAVPFALALLAIAAVVIAVNVLVTYLGG